MKKIVFALAIVAAIAAAIGYMTPVYGQASGDSAPIFLTEIPPGYRDWRLISVSRLTVGKLGQLRAQVGNDIAIKAYQEGTLPFPDGSIIAALHWNDAVSEENNKVLAMLSISLLSFYPTSSNLSLLKCVLMNILLILSRILIRKPFSFILYVF
jgi:hypothetical protein